MAGREPCRVLAVVAPTASIFCCIPAGSVVYSLQGERGQESRPPVVACPVCAVIASGLFLLRLFQQFINPLLRLV